jgi:hypothetical protein
MIKRLSRIAPFQAGKTLAATYFLMGLILAVPIALIVSLAPAAPGQSRPSPLVVICLPFLYGAAAFVFVPLGCWIYNIAARWMGGIEVEVDSGGEA